MDQLFELRDLVLRHAVRGRKETAIPRLGLLRAHAQSVPAPAFYEPVLCVAVQGAKRLLVGDKTITYDPENFLVVAVDLPVIGCVVDASEERPYLCVTIGLDRLAMVDVLSSLPPADPGEAGIGLAVGALDADLLDSVIRLVRLVERPAESAVLAPLYEREILFRLLTGPAGGVLRQMVAHDSRLARIDRAIDWIKRHFDRPMRIEGLAEIAGMSPASLHRHFKAVTAMSPLQFQKQMRLQEARRRLVSEPLDAGLVGFAVGYESPSQFSREYARLFGAPPLRDVARLRGLPAPDHEGAEGA